MLRPWDEEPDKYEKKVFCESCGKELKEHFELCDKCGSSAYHEARYSRRVENE